MTPKVLQGTSSMEVKTVSSIATYANDSIVNMEEVKTLPQALGNIGKIEDHFSVKQEELDRSLSYYLGRTLFQANVNLTHEEYLEVCKSKGISKNKSYRYIAIYERNVGIDKLFPTFHKSGNNSDDNYEYTILKQYQKTLQSKPAMSQAFDEVDGFKMAKKRNGDTEYRVMDEAIMFDDATHYYDKSCNGKGSTRRMNLKLKEFKSYLLIADDVADELGIDVWNVSVDQVLNAVEKAVEDEEGDIEDKAEAIAFVTRSQAEKDRDFKDRIRDAHSFKHWYAKEIRGYKMETVAIETEDKVNQEFNDLTGDWKAIRKGVISVFHPDSINGSAKAFQAIKKVDNLLNLMLKKEDLKDQWQMAMEVKNDVDTLPIDEVRQLFKQYSEKEDQ